MDARMIVAIVIAGLAATLIDNAAAALLFGADFWSLTLERPGRFAVAVGLAALIPAILGAVTGVAGYAVAFIVLAGVAAALAKTVFAYATPLPNVIVLTSIYAVAALLVFAALRRRAR